MEAMAKLKAAMQQVPILALPDFDEKFVVETDASGVGVGAVLSQQGRPITFFDRALVGIARFKSVYERELMAIVWAVQKWRHYLLGRHFIVRIDQKSLKYSLEQRMVAPDY